MGKNDWIFDIFDQSRTILDINWLIWYKIGQDLINFVATIWSDFKISDQKSWLKVDLNTISNKIWLKVDLIALAYFTSVF